MTRLMVTCCLLTILTGCINEDRVLYVSDLSVDIETSSEGPITVVFHHARQGDGITGHPLGQIEEAVFDATTVEYQLTVPISEGEGLVLYGWQDVDGDGVLCAPGVDDEPSGLVEVTEFPAHALEITLPLDAMCRGAEALFP